MKSDLAIARETTIRPIADIVSSIGLTMDDVIPYGHAIAKLPLSLQETLQDRLEGKLILVTAMTPTPMGEGKKRSLLPAQLPFAGRVPPELALGVLASDVLGIDMLKDAGEVGGEGFAEDR